MSSTAFTIVRCPDQTWLLGGELDAATAPQIDEALQGVYHGTVVLDCRGLTFMDSSGINALVRAARKLHDGVVVVQGARGAVARVLELTQIGSLPRVEVL